METWKLPKGWEWVELKQICKINMGQSPPSSTYNHEKIGLPFYQGKADFGDLFPTPKIWCSKPQKIANGDDILITVRAPVGPTNLANEKCCIGRGLAAISPLGGIPSLLVLHYLRRIEKDLAKTGSGSTFSAINRSDLDSVKFPLPPLEEGKLMISKIEELFKESKTARDMLEKIPSILKQFRQVILFKAFKGDLIPQDLNDESSEELIKKIKNFRKKKWEEDLKSKGKDPNKFKYEEPEDLEKTGLSGVPYGWVWTTINQICFTSSGGTPLRSKKEYYGNEIPWVKSGELKDTIINNTEEMITKIGLDNSSAKIFPKGTVLVAMYGANVGKTGILGIDAATNQAVCAMFNDERILNTEYLFLYLRSKKENLIKKSFGGAQPNISQEVINKLEISLPSINLQIQIVKKIKELFSLIDQIEKSVEEAKNRADKIDQSIRIKTFSGNLVPQNPKDEPASILLERIRHEKEHNTNS